MGERSQGREEFVWEASRPGLTVAYHGDWTIVMDDDQAVAQYLDELLATLGGMRHPTQPTRVWIREAERAVRQVFGDDPPLSFETNFGDSER